MPSRITLKIEQPKALSLALHAQLHLGPPTTMPLTTFASVSTDRPRERCRVNSLCIALPCQHGSNDHNPETSLIIGRTAPSPCSFDPILSTPPEPLTGLLWGSSRSCSRTPHISRRSMPSIGRTMRFRSPRAPGLSMLTAQLCSRPFVMTMTRSAPRISSTAPRHPIFDRSPRS